jgi:hypothetical protein
VDAVGIFWTSALALWCVAWFGFCVLALGYGRQTRAALLPEQALNLSGVESHLHRLGFSEPWRVLPSGEAPTLLRLHLKLLAQAAAEPEPSFLDEMILVPGPTFMPLRPYETLLYADEIGQMGEAARRALLNRLSYEEGETRVTLRAS